MTKRIVIFAAFNRGKQIDDYVIYYLNGLKKIADKIIYVADNNPSEAYEQQLKGLADIAIFEKHGEYDFGSWKRGFAAAVQNNWLDDADQLVLCNDSCYAPAFPFAEMFAAMEQKHVDFWGITKNCTGIIEHIQSYFLVFEPQVFKTELLANFFRSVRAEKCFWDVVSHYEVGLSRLLIEEGHFTFDVYCPIKAGRHDASKLGTKLLKVRCPLYKRKIFTRGGFAECSKFLLIHNMPNQAIKQFMQHDYWAFFKERWVYSIKRFLWQSKTTKSGKHLIKICRIPLWSSSK